MLSGVNGTWASGVTRAALFQKALPIMTALALIALLVTLPVVDYTTAYRTYDTDLISVSLPCCLAALFIGVLLHKF